MKLACVTILILLFCGICTAQISKLTPGSLITSLKNKDRIDSLILKTYPQTKPQLSDRGILIAAETKFFGIDGTLSLNQSTDHQFGNIKWEPEKPSFSAFSQAKKELQQCLGSPQKDPSGDLTYTNGTVAAVLSLDLEGSFTLLIYYL
jgi:hypothetical protein